MALPRKTQIEIGELLKMRKDAQENLQEQRKKGGVSERYLKMLKGNVESVDKDILKALHCIDIK